MVLRHLIPKLEAHFPGQFHVAGTVLSFPEKHPLVGSVEVHDDAEELTVYAGNFSHLHFSSYDSSLSKEQAAERIADDTLAFLIKLFADQIVMWGSHGGRGGCYERETGPSSIFSFNRGQEYVWSGPISKQGKQAAGSDSQRRSAVARGTAAALGLQMKRVALFTFGVLLLCGMGLWSIGFLGPTWVKFQSSDGEWADSEILTKGRRFEDIATLFELYRSKCNSAASLQRTTRRPSWFTFEHWFNDYSEPKWLVPYAEGLPKTASGHYPEASANHCANRLAG